MNINNNISKTLLKSSSKLTGNYKLVIEDSNNIYLNSINVNNNLNSFEFQKNLINIFDFHNQLYSFFNKMQKSDIYAYDASYYKFKPLLNDNIYYNKKFRFFAPLTISTNNNPDYFIIFKIDDPDFNFDTFDFNNIEDYKINTIYKSKIVKYFNLKENRIGNLITNIKYNLLENIYEIVDNEIFINGINLDNGIVHKTIVDIDNPDVDFDVKLINSFEKNNFISNKILNLEFLFDDYSNDPNKFIGLYFYKEELTKFEIDFEQHEIYDKTYVIDKYLNTNDSYLVDNKLYVKNFNSNIGEIFEYECESTGNDYGFYYNPYCGTDINNTEHYLEWISYYGYEFDFWINCTYNYNIDNYNYMYAVQDRNNKIYNIKEFNKDITLVDDSIYLDSFYGIDKSILIPGEIIYETSPNILKLNILKNENIFNNGDWIQIKIGIENNYFIWRLYADTGSCCDAVENCYNTGIEYEFQSCDLLFTRRHNTIILNAKIDKDIDVEENTYISLSCDKFKNVKFKIDKVQYNYDSDDYTITIIDFLGHYFKYCNDIQIMNFKYKGQSYYYNTFYPKGTIKQILNNIKDSFESFQTLLFDVFVYDETLIFKAKHDGKLYKNFNFSYDFTKSLSDESNIIINDIPLKGTLLVDSNLYEIEKRKRGNNINFYGGDYYKNGNKFIIDKDWAINNLNGNELILFNSNKKRPLKKFEIENTQFYYYNYLNDPVFFNDEIVNYKFFNNYLTFAIDYDSEIYKDDTKMIYGFYEYYPMFVRFFSQEFSEI